MTTHNTQRLEELMQPHRQEFDVLKIALAEVSAEDAANRKEEAKKLIRAAMELKVRMEKAEKQFQREKASFDKQLGRSLNQLAAMARGETIPVGGDQEPEKDEDTE